MPCFQLTARTGRSPVRPPQRGGEASLGGEHEADAVSLALNMASTLELRLCVAPVAVAVLVFRLRRGEA